MKKVFLLLLLLLLTGVAGCKRAELKISGPVYVEVGERIQLVTNYADEVIWTSRNSDLAAVDERGYVTGIKPGSVKIIAKALQNPAVVDSIVVIVQEKAQKPVPVPTIIENILLGVDNQEGVEAALQGGRVALLTNQSGVDKQYRPTADRFAENPAINLTALLAAEHGLYGTLEAGAYVGDTTDPKNGLPVFSLYKTLTKAEQDKIAEAADIFCIDIQDVGVSFYTYIFTMLKIFRIAQEYGKKLVVLDRPNPLNAYKVAGPYITRDGIALPVRHGMTIGELALFMNQELQLSVDVVIVKMTNYDRFLYLRETNLPWIAPSPNMPSRRTAEVYPGMCLIEMTNLSEGRGTTLPFEQFGAPWINARAYVSALNSALAEQQLEGAVFTEAHFTPTFSKHEGKLCSGARINITNLNAYESVKVGLIVLAVTKELYPEDFTYLGTTYLRNILGEEFIFAPLAEQLSRVTADAQEFATLRERYLIY